MQRFVRHLPILAVLFPGLLQAQASTTVSSYVASDAGANGNPVLVGAAVGAEAGRLAIRLGAAVDPRLTPPVDVVGPSGLWTAEADAMLYLRDPEGDAPVIPYAIAGVGLRSFREQSSGPTAATLSYGAGVRIPVLDRVAMEGEARYRRPLSSAPEFTPAGIEPGFEVRFGLSVRLGGSGSASARRPATPPPAYVSAPVEMSREESAAAERRRIAMRALDKGDDFLGVRYTWGGNTPKSGFDCSGFVRYVFRDQGIELPRVSRDQARSGTPLPLSLKALEPGDLMAFASKGTRVDHIGIYAGDNRILHSSSSGGGVRLDRLDSKRGEWLIRHWVAARRVIHPSPLSTTN